jgi:hypothetical protein
MAESRCAFTGVQWACFHTSLVYALSDTKHIHLSIQIIQSTIFRPSVDVRVMLCLTSTNKRVPDTRARQPHCSFHASNPTLRPIYLDDSLF